MFKKTITYTDFDNNERTETHYFNMTQSELISFATEMPDDVTNSLKTQGENVDPEKAALALIEKIGGKGIINFIKELMLKSYGIKSEDGRRFIKSKEISDEFAQTIAFDEIFMEFMQDEKAGSDFVNAVIPASLLSKMPGAGNGQVIPMK